MLEIARVLIAINLCVNVIFLLIFFSVLLRGVVCCNLTVVIEQICTTVSRFVYCNIANSVYITSGRSKYDHCPPAALPVPVVT